MDKANVLIDMAMVRMRLTTRLCINSFFHISYRSTSPQCMNQCPPK